MQKIGEIKVNHKECYAISVNNKVLAIIQEEHCYLQVLECDNILIADFYSSIKEVKDMIFSLTHEHEDKRWTFSDYYKEEELKIVRINLSYEILK